MGSRDFFIFRSEWEVGILLFEICLFLVASSVLDNMGHTVFSAALKIILDYNSDSHNVCILTPYKYMYANPTPISIFED